jgi:hypothetical protein
VPSTSQGDLKKDHKKTSAPSLTADQVKVWFENREDILPAMTDFFTNLSYC